MRNRTKAVVLAATLAGATASGTSIAAACGGDDAEQPISADALDQASDAALGHLGGGRVTDTEVGDEESYYEVEVTQDDGTQVDVQLDQSFAVVGTEIESENEQENDE